MSLTRIMGLFVVLLFAGCECDDPEGFWSFEGDYEVRVMNNLNDEILIAYDYCPDLDMLEIVTDGCLDLCETETKTVPANEEETFTMHFNSMGTVYVTVAWEGKEQRYAVSVEKRVVSVDADDFD